MALLFRKPRGFQYERLHVGQDEPRVERAGTVDVPDASCAVDEKDAQGMVKGTLWIGSVKPFVHGLVVSDENRL